MEGQRRVPNNPLYLSVEDQRGGPPMDPYTSKEKQPGDPHMNSENSVNDFGTTVLPIPSYINDVLLIFAL